MAVSSELLHTFRYAVHILEIPPEVAPLYSQCEDIGFQYSMESYFTEFLKENIQMTAAEWQFADFIWIPQCVSVIYWKLRNGGEEHHAALLTAEESYLKPVVEWAVGHPAHRRFNGGNFFTVLSMDLGRQDFPTVINSTKNWTIGTLTGHTSWLTDHGVEVDQHGPCYEDDVKLFAQARVAMPHDFVIPIPSRFAMTHESLVFERPRLLFFAGSLNSCARRWLFDLHKEMAQEDVLVTDTILNDAEYRAAMYSSRYCLVLRGSSHTNNVRLYDVIAHGCIPVIVSDDFQPPLESLLSWGEFALFFGTTSIPSLVTVLREIPEETRRKYFETLVMESSSPGRALDWRYGAFWTLTFFTAAVFMREHCAMLGPAWFQSGLDLHDAAFERYSEFLDRIECPRQFCTTQKVSTGLFGCADAETMIPAIAAIHRQLVVEGKHLVFIDGGANTGKLTHKILASSGELFARRLAVEQPETEGRVSCPLMPELAKVTVISVEPSSSNFRQLRAMAEKQRWDLEAWHGVNCALSDYDGDGSLSVFPEWSLDEVATLEPSNNDSREQQFVEVVTLETLRERYFKDREILLLKLDVEGAELPALIGARDLMLKRAINFIVFEYSQDTWKSPLREMVRYLFSVGYVCCLISERDLFPVSGVFWNDAFEQIVWSNFFCVAIDNPLLSRLMSAYVVDGPGTWNLMQAMRDLYS